eukprot:1386485-Amorphochlora_amoeboformis.AAC.2
MQRIYLPNPLAGMNVSAVSYGDGTLLMGPRGVPPKPRPVALLRQFGPMAQVGLIFPILKLNPYLKCSNFLRCMEHSAHHQGGLVSRENHEDGFDNPPPNPSKILFF